MLPTRATDLGMVSVVLSPGLTMILHLAIRLFVVALFSHVVCAQRNITIDDTDSSIAYAPAGAWVTSLNSTLDFGGTHTLTQNPNATAILNFTGIAIYFLSPKWPYTVNTQLSLDGATPVLVDLIDHTRPDVAEGPETVQSAVVWNATGLNNTQHTLIISVGAGQPFGIVDGIIFTTNDTTTTTTSSAASIPSSTSSSTTSTATPIITDPVVAPAVTSQADSSPKRIRVLPIVLGSLFGLIGIGVMLLALIFACRRHRRPKSEAWTIDGTQYSSPSSRGNSANNPYTPMTANGASHWDVTSSSVGATGYPMGQTQQGTWQNTRYGYVGMTPPPPMPSQADAGRAPNRYQPGTTLSTITEKSTPHMGEVHASLANSPASGHSGDLPSGYYTAPGSTTSSSRRAYFGMPQNHHAAGQRGLPEYSAQAPQGQGQGQGRATTDTYTVGRAGWI